MSNTRVGVTQTELPNALSISGWPEETHFIKVNIGEADNNAALYLKIPTPDKKREFTSITLDALKEMLDKFDMLEAIRYPARNIEKAVSETKDVLKEVENFNIATSDFSVLTIGSFVLDDQTYYRKSFSGNETSKFTTGSGKEIDAQVGGIFLVILKETGLYD